MGWANTFATLVDSLDAPRTDCPLTLAELPEVAEGVYDSQRAKKINEHTESDLAFYCARNHPAEHLAGSCPPARARESQGAAADWLLPEAKAYRAKLAAAEQAMLLQVASDSVQ
jgi:hypothetical protein